MKLSLVTIMMIHQTRTHTVLTQSPGDVFLPAGISLRIVYDIVPVFLAAARVVPAFLIMLAATLGAIMLNKMFVWGCIEYTCCWTLSLATSVMSGGRISWLAAGVLRT